MVLFPFLTALWPLMKIATEKSSLPARRTSQNGGLARVSGSNGDFSSIVIASK
jgi:hypothetical protein